MNWVEFNSEVFYSSDDIIKVDRAGINQLQQKAQQGPRNRSRLCSHRGVDDPLHEMLIVHEKGIYVRPHKHVGKSESFHVIEGDVDIVLFDDAGGEVAPGADHGIQLSLRGLSTASSEGHA